MAETQQSYDVFLSHALADRQRIETPRARIAAWGYSVRIDPADDGDCGRVAPDRGAAERLRQRLRRCRSIIYAVSSQAKVSRWLPWELGYADACCGRIFIFPLDEGAGDYARKMDFLSLYPVIDTRNLGGFLRRHVPKGGEGRAAPEPPAANGAATSRVITEMPPPTADPAAAARWQGEFWRAWWSMLGLRH
jgi:hypothetical protein